MANVDDTWNEAAAATETKDEEFEATQAYAEEPEVMETPDEESPEA